jgi:hypothetical protein
VAAAIQRNELDPRRAANYFRLRAEQERTAEAVEEKLHREKRLGKAYKQAKSNKGRKRG